MKPFGVAKARLAGSLDRGARSRLGRAVAARTAAAARDAGAVTAIVTADDGVRRWATGLGHEVIDETTGDGVGLDRAADAAARYAAARDLAWAVVHADLPLVTPGDLAVVFSTTVAGETVLAPSHDGGSNVVAGHGATFPFAYGPSSFHRHLTARPGAVVVCRPGLALDLDTPRDLAVAVASWPGRWLVRFLGSALP